MGHGADHARRGGLRYLVEPGAAVQRCRAPTLVPAEKAAAPPELDEDHA